MILGGCCYKVISPPSEENYCVLASPYFSPLDVTIKRCTHFPHVNALLREMCGVRAEKSDTGAWAGFYGCDS